MPPSPAQMKCQEPTAGGHKPRNGAALDGIHVVDLAGTVATAYCGKLFRDLGAEVTNLEPPGKGHPIRGLPPFHPGAATPEASGLATYLSLGKQSVAVDAGDEGGLAFLRAADVILDADPGPNRQLEADQIRLSISWFGAGGPYAGRAATDQVINTHIGAVRAVGPAKGPPILTTGHTPQIVAGTLAYVGGVGHLLARECGRLTAPIHLDVSVFEAAMCITEPGPPGTLATGEIRPRVGINRFWPTYPTGIYPCRDGWLGVTTVTPSQWRSLCSMLGLPELGSEPRYQISINRLEDADAIDAALGPRFLERTALEWVEAGQAARVPLALAPTPAELFELDQFRDRGAWVEAEHPDQGRFATAGTPFRLHRTPAVAGGRAPRLGEHNGNVPEPPAARRQPSGAAEMPASAARRPGLLQDIRIVDLTMGWAGPLASRQLADMGAEVIKVESCQYFDWWRGWESTPESIEQKLYEQSTAFNSANRNKFGITLDLTSRRGKGLLLRLVAISDAVIENYTASVLPKLGLAYNRLCEVNPELVMVSMPPFGASGEWMNHRAYGSTVEQASGLPHLNGRAEDPPTMQHVAFGDPIAGINAAAGSVDRAPAPPADRRGSVRRSLPRPIDVSTRRSWTSSSRPSAASRLLAAADAIRCTRPGASTRASARNRGSRSRSRRTSSGGSFAACWAWTGPNPVSTPLPAARSPRTTSTGRSPLGRTSTTAWRSSAVSPRRAYRRRSSAIRWTCSTTRISKPAATGSGANAPSSATSPTPPRPTGRWAATAAPTPSSGRRRPWASTAAKCCPGCWA